jgi:hypothetical protein
MGGRYELEPNPPSDLVRQAHQALAVIPQPLLYARVDGIVRDGKLVVIELELLEPALFFDVEPVAAGTFCERVDEIIV